MDNAAHAEAEEGYFPARTPKADHNLWSSRIKMQDNVPREDGTLQRIVPGKRHRRGLDQSTSVAAV